MRSSEQRDYVALPERTAVATDASSEFNSQAATDWFVSSVQVGTAAGAVVGGIGSVAYFGWQFLASGAACPRNPLDPCDGGPCAILLLLMAIPGAAVGAGAGCVAGTVTGALTAPCVGFFQSQPHRAVSVGPARQSMSSIELKPAVFDASTQEVVSGPPRLSM